MSTTTTKIETVYFPDSVDDAGRTYRASKARIEMPEDYDPSEVTRLDVVRDAALREVDEGAPYEILASDGDVVLVAAPGTTYTDLADAEEALDAWRAQDPSTSAEYWIADFEGERID